MTVKQVFYTGDLTEPDDSRMCLMCKQGTLKSPHQCEDCGKDMHPWYPSEGEPGMHWRCDCGTSLFVLTDPDDGPDPVAVCDNEQCGHRFMTEDEVKQDSSETNVYGDPTEDGHGEVMSSGWVNPDWSTWQVTEDRDDEAPDVYEPEDEFEERSPAQWLAETVTSRLGAIDSYDGGGTFYAADASSNYRTGQSIRLAAHPEGFTPEEMEEACRLMR